MGARSPAGPRVLRTRSSNYRERRAETDSAHANILGPHPGYDANTPYFTANRSLSLGNNLADHGLDRDGSPMSKPEKITETVPISRAGR